MKKMYSQEKQRNQKNSRKDGVSLEILWNLSVVLETLLIVSCVIYSLELGQLLFLSIIPLKLWVFSCIIINILLSDKVLKSDATLEY